MKIIKQKIKSLQMILFFFLSIQANFKNYVLKDIESDIEKNIKNKNPHSNILVETGSESEINLFIEVYKNYLKNKTDFKEIITFDRYNFITDKWTEEPGEIPTNINILKKALEKKSSTLIILKRAELLQEDAYINFLKELLHFKKKFFQENISLSFILQITNKNNLKQEIIDANLFPIDFFYQSKLKNTDYKLTLFKKILQLELKESLDFNLHDMRCKALLSVLNNFSNLFDFFSYIKAQKEPMPEDLFYKTLFNYVFNDLENRNHVDKKCSFNEHQKNVIATHEIGHALVSFMLNQKYPNNQLSFACIYKNNKDAAGRTYKKNYENHYILDAQYYYNQIYSLLGGKIAEQEIFEYTSNGSKKDQKQATEIAEWLVTNGLGKSLAIFSEHNEFQKEKIREEVNHILRESEARVIKIIQENKELIKLLSKKLVEKEILFEDEFEEVITQFKAKK